MPGVMPRLPLPFVSFALLAVPLCAQEVAWWQQDLAGALAAAADKPAKLLLLYCFMSDSADCENMWAKTVSDASVQPLLADFLCMGAKRGEPIGDEAHKRFAVRKLPTVLFVQPDGSLADVVAGYVPLATFTAELQRVRAGTDTLTALRAAVQQAPADLARQLRLADKLRRLGLQDEADQVVAAIVAKDPKGKTEAGAEAMLLQLCAQLAAAEPKDAALKALREFLIKQKNKRLLFLGYDRIAAVEYARNDLQAACDMATRAWKNIPPDQVLVWGQNIASKAYKHHKELDRNQLKLALDISEKALDAVEQQCKQKPDAAFLANALYLHAAVLIVNNLRKDAFAAMERAMQLNPDDENLKKALDSWKSGAK